MLEEDFSTKEQEVDENNQRWKHPQAQIGLQHRIKGNGMTMRFYRSKANWDFPHPGCEEFVVDPEEESQTETLDWDGLEELGPQAVKIHGTHFCLTSVQTASL